MRILSKTLLALSLITTVVHAETFIVKKGDTLSQVAEQFLGKPIYSSKGSLRKLIALNPQIKNPNFIRPGQIIYVSTTTEEVAVEPQEDTFEPEPVIEMISAPEEIPAEDTPVIKTTYKFGASTGLEYLDINASGKEFNDKANLVMSPVPTVKLFAERDWSEKYSSRFTFAHAFEPKVDTRANQELKNSQGHRSRFSLDLTRKINDQFRVRGIGAYARRSFIKAESDEVLSLDRIYGFEIGGGAEFDFFKKEKSTIGAGLDAFYLAPSSGAGYTTDSGYSTLANVYLRHQLSSMMLEASTYYGHWNQDTKFVSQKVNTLGFNVGLSWSFDK